MNGPADWPQTVGEAVARARFASFDLAGLTAGGHVVHLRAWNPAALKRFGAPPEVTLEVVAEAWPGRRGVRVAVLGFYRRAAAVLVLAGREGDDDATEYVLDAPRLRAAERALNGWLPPRHRVGRARSSLVDVRRGDPRDSLAALWSWVGWSWEMERPESPSRGAA